MVQGIHYLIQIFPKTMRNDLGKILEDEEKVQCLEEIRIRIRQPIQLIYDTREEWLVTPMEEAYFEEMLNYISGYSMYAYQEELCQGYITIRGGHRIGMSGVVKMNRESVGRMQQIYFMNIRVAKEKIGCAGKLFPYLFDIKGEYLNTLIVSLPGAGKTTLLRDLIRMISNGKKNYPGRKICVIDERSEIAASYQGIPQNDLGPRTDVLDNCPKAIGMQMVLRSMSPDIIAVDELGGKEDFAAVAQAMKSGVTVLGTMQAGSVEEIFLREEACRKWGEEGKMRFVGLKRKTPNMAGNKSRKVTVYDGTGRVLWEN